MKMRILFITGINITNPTLIGVIKKINGQVNAMRSLGHEVVFSYIINNELIFEYPDLSKEKIAISNNSIVSRIKSYKEFIKNTKTNKYDIIFIRINDLNPFLLLALKKIKNNNIKIIFELPTYPVKEEAKLLEKKYVQEKQFGKLLFYKINRLMEGATIPFVKFVVDWIVTYSLDKRIYGVNTIAIGNGINLKEIKKKTYLSTKENVINVIGVANLSIWHGFDRVIHGLEKDSNIIKSNNVIFNIVGTGSEENTLKSLTMKLGVSKNVIFHGVKRGNELDELFDKCDLAVSSLGMHRIGLTEGAVLKTREYCARGIPFIYGYNDVDIKNNYPFALKVPADESYININDLIDFYNLNKQNELTNEIMRDCAKKNFTWELQMKKVFKEVWKES
ncbi:glycosyltransferase [Bacillus sp. JJ1532]|uniref:glycosyltransferase n=1 Tax=Bacillus sp. JJ1532 TaxID=3122958 RepID=UPI002FFDF57F